MSSGQNIFSDAVITAFFRQYPTIEKIDAQQTLRKLGHSKKLERDAERRFWFRLARRLGMSVRRCRQEVDRREFIEWLKFDELEPGLGEERDDWRLGG